jgi:hypothetical protein
MKNRSTYYSHGVLRSWNQRRCLKCQRFLGKRQGKYCSRCRENENLKVANLWRCNHREDINRYQNQRNMKIRSETECIIGREPRMIMSPIFQNKSESPPSV